MRGKRRNALIAAHLAAVLSICALVLPRSAAEPPPAADLVDTAYGSDYQIYLQAQKQAPAFEGRQPADSVAPNGAQTVSYEGKSALLLAGESHIDYTFTVPKAALYCVELNYNLGGQASADALIALSANGKTPFTELDNVLLKRVWRDAGQPERDNKGNDLMREQEQVPAWGRFLLQDFSLVTADPFLLYLEAGTHKITLKNSGSVPVYVADVALCGRPAIRPTAERLTEYDSMGLELIPDFFQTVQAEEAHEKSDSSLFAGYDRTDPSVQPYETGKLRRGTVGQNWWMPGMWISYQITDVPADGLYYLTLKYKQNMMYGASTHRTFEINGEVPAQCLSAVPFTYGDSYENKTLADESGKPFPIHLKQGTNEIKIHSTQGKSAPLLGEAFIVSNLLNELYIKILMITGNTPDKYRDYFLEKEIPGLTEAFWQQHDRLLELAEEYDRLNSQENTGSEPLRRAARQLQSMLEKPETIPARIAGFRDSISLLSDWIHSSLEQPLLLDYFMIHSADAEIPSPKPGFLQSVRHFFSSFFLSFFEDYSVVDSAEGSRTISVWMNSGRDQVQILKSLITDSFTPQTGISVDLSLVQLGFIEATLAGIGPDVAMGVERGQPVNLACRGALQDLSGYPGYDEIAARFSATATLPYQWEGGTYGLPDTQTFFVLFARTDLMAQLGLTPPETWEELRQILPRLQKKHMQVGLPYSVISAAMAVNYGLGAKDLFPTLLMQHGGRFFKEDGSAVDFDSQEAADSFAMWCEFYTQYGFELVFDNYTRFRNGEMPLLIAAFDLCNTFNMAAPEIKGHWKMYPMPGIRQLDGSINRSVGGAGAATVMFSKAAAKEDCFRFIEWWARGDTQTGYNDLLGSVWGTSWRNPTANLEAFSALSWNKDERAVLEQQRTWVKEIPEVPGSYFVSRSLDNAIRAVIFENKRPRDVFAKQTDLINREMKRKQNELRANR